MTEQPNLRALPPGAKSEEAKKNATKQSLQYIIDLIEEPDM